jgi:dipeptidyl aminopeptidase/acylaminoacyl peptidase
MIKSLLRSAVFGIAALCLQPPAMAQQAAPPISAFARLPATTGVSISPDGERIAYITNEGDQRFIVNQHLGSGEIRIVDVSNLRAFSTTWYSNTLLTATVGELSSIFQTRGGLDYTTLITIDTETMEAEQLVRPRQGFGLNQTTARVAGYDAGSERLLMPLVDDESSLNLYAVNPENGWQRSLIARGRGNAMYWMSDPARNRHVRVSYSDWRNRFSVDIEDNGEWRSLVRAEQELIELGVQGFMPDGDRLAISYYSYDAPYTRRLQAMSIQDGALGEILFQDDRFDFEDVRIDPHTGYVVGVTIDREHSETIWFDGQLASHQSGLSAAFGDTPITLVDWSEDRNRLIVRTESSTRPPVYYLVDMSARSANPVRLSYPELNSTPLTERRLISYTARDGVQIPAYLAHPASEGPKPYVVLVHGGPNARDTGGFDPFAHLLTSRGYGVIQPQFRGSSGHGALWTDAGRGEWGRGVMQHDVSDAVTYLRESGLADEVCIMGMSYGGYAALAGASFTPDLYDCAISINGVSDTAEMISYVEDRYGDASQSAAYWRLTIGGEDTNSTPAGLLEENSPLNYADAIRIPVLLVHGEDDTVVPVRQSRDMRRRLEREGKEVRFVELQGGDHWMLEYETRRNVMEEVDAFLARHLGD